MNDTGLIPPGGICFHHRERHPGAAFICCMANPVLANR